MTNTATEKQTPRKQNKIEEVNSDQFPKGFPHLAIQVFIGVSFALGIFHLYTSFAGPLVDFLQRDIHLFVLLALAFLLYPAIKGSNKFTWRNIAFSLFTVCIGVYLFLAYNRIVNSGGDISTLDLAVGACVLLLVLEATRRALGWELPLLALIFLGYGLFAKLSFYPSLNSQIILQALKSIMTHLVFITEGVFSTAIGVSASYIVLFVMFGAFLLKTGLGEFFHDLSLAISGGSDGGPAKVATIASGMLGSINGSAVANVVTTGTFTIPLMKKVGYDRNFAGAVEASASVGGQILPPVMGAAAFIMAENLGIPYIKIVLAGIIPALLYYFGILSQVHLRAKRFGLKGISKDNLPRLKHVLLSRGYVLFPVIVLIFLLFSGKTIIFAASWSIISVMLISATSSMLILLVPLSLAIVLRHTFFSLFREGITVYSSTVIQLLVIVGISIIMNLIFSSRRSLSGKMTVDAIHDGIRSTIPVALACACVGIVVGIATLTGVAISVAQFVITVGENIQIPVIQLFLTLVLTMIASIFLGMGLPSIPTYIITSTMAAPILLGIGIFREIAGTPELGLFIAHMFVFYFGIFANITPPVALAAYAAAGISGGNPTITGYQALKLSLAGFIVPYIFVFSPELLMINPDFLIIQTVITAIIGVFILSTAIEGYWIIIAQSSISAFFRILLGCAALLLVYPGTSSDIIGFLVAGFVMFVILKRSKAPSA